MDQLASTCFPKTFSMEFGLGADVSVLKIPKVKVDEFVKKYTNELDLTNSLENEESVFFFLANSESLFKIINAQSLQKDISIVAYNVGPTKELIPEYLKDVEMSIEGKYIENAITAIDFINSHSQDCFLKAMVEGLAPNCFVGPMGELKEQKTYVSQEELYPYLLINVRTGASFFQVSSSTDYKRITGNTIGFFTFAGLAKLGADAQDPMEALDLARHGDNSTIDMTVGDIYGTDYEAMKLPKNLIASSFGKLKNSKEMPKREDVCKSLMTLVSLNTVQIGYLVATIENLKRIVMIGTNMHAAEIQNLAQAALTFESQNEDVQLLFPKYSNFLGALGLLLSAK